MIRLLESVQCQFVCVIINVCAAKPGDLVD